MTITSTPRYRVPLVQPESGEGSAWQRASIAGFDARGAAVMQPVHNWLQTWRGLMARAVHRAAALIASNSPVRIEQLMWTPAATDRQTGTGQTLGVAVPAQLLAALREMQPEEQREFARMALVTISKQASDSGDTGTPSIGEQLYRMCRLLACSDEDLRSVRSEPNDLAAAAASATEDAQLECNPELVQGLSEMFAQRDELLICICKNFTPLLEDQFVRGCPAEAKRKIL